MRMIKHRDAIGFVSSIVLAMATLAPSKAGAVEIFSQAPMDEGPGIRSDFTSAGGIFGFQQGADNFSLSADTAVTSLGWFGAYGGPDFDNAEPDDFAIRFFRDNGSGVPEARPYVDVPPSALVRTLTNLTGLGKRFAVYEYSTPLPAPVALDANTPYYVSIVNNTSTGEWFWHASDFNPAFFRPQDGDQWTETPEPEVAFRLNERARLVGPQLFVKEFLDANPPLPPPVEIEVFLDGANGQPSTELITLSLQSAVDASGARLPFVVSNVTPDPLSPGDLARVEFGPQVANGLGESFFDLLIDLSLGDGTELDLVHLRDLNVLGPDFFSAWFDVAGVPGVITYHTLFESTGGEFFDVLIGDPGSSVFPVSFGMRGEPGFTVTITASHRVPEPATSWLMLLGIAVLGSLRYRRHRLMVAH